MRIENSGISSLNQPSFENKVRSRANVQNNNTASSRNAYRLDISQRSQDMMQMYKDEPLAIFNSDVLSYSKDLKLNSKY